MYSYHVQVLLPLLKTDLYDIAMACVSESLASEQLQFHHDKHAVAVVTVSEGYPGSYKKGMEITGQSLGILSRSSLHTMTENHPAQMHYTLLDQWPVISFIAQEAVEVIIGQ